MRITAIRRGRMRRLLLASSFWLCGLALAAGPAQAQGTQDYLQDNSVYSVDRDGAAPVGADDSTVGTVSENSMPQLSISPSARVWSNTSAQNFTISNSGEMRSSQITARVSNGNFLATNGCGILGPGQSCTVQVRPVSSAGTSATLTVEAQFGGTVTAGLTMVPPASLSMSPGSASWDQNYSTRSFTVRNNGGQRSSTISAALSSGAAYFNVSTNCSTLAGGQNCTVQVAPKSSVEAIVSGTLRVSASQGGTMTASLSADLEPEIVNPCAGAPSYRQNATYRVEPACLYWDDVHGIKHIVITNVSGSVLRASSGEGASIINPWRSGFILSGTAFGGTACPAIWGPGAICRLGIQHLLITRPIGISSFNFPLYPTAQTRIGARHGSQSIYADVHASCTQNCAYWVTQ